MYAELRYCGCDDCRADRVEAAAESAKARLIESPSFKREAIENNAVDVLAAFSAPNPAAALDVIVARWADQGIASVLDRRDMSLDDYCCLFERDDTRAAA